MKITERYSTAIHSSALTVDTKTTMSDTDVLAAFGFADKALKTGRDSQGLPVKPAPLAVPLERLFSGDNRAAIEIVMILANMAYTQSWIDRVKISRVQALDMAKACLAWHRDGTCKPCGGHGLTLIPGTKTHSEHDCPACFGKGKIPFESNFRQEHKALARWLVVQMDREAGRAGPAAMQKLAERMEL